MFAHEQMLTKIALVIRTCNHDETSIDAVLAHVLFLCPFLCLGGATLVCACDCTWQGREEGWEKRRKKKKWAFVTFTWLFRV